ncbi:reverse transcriptase domain-containing protein [Tanacetum coccineum]
MDSSSNSEGIAAIVNKLDSLGRDMKKLKENMHTIQVGCYACEGAHLDKECPLNEELKSVKKVKYGEIGRSLPFSNGAKYHVGPPRYYTHIDNRPSFGEKRPSLEEENAEINTRNQSASLKNLENQIEQLTKEFHAKIASEVNNSSVDRCKAVYTNKEAPLNNKLTNPTKYLLSKKKVYLGTSINVIPKSMFEHLKLARLKKTDMLVEMADTTKRAPIRIVKNVLVKIDKLLFLSDFVVIDMLNTRNETMILRRPLLATIHVKIDVFNKEISLGIRDDKVTFNTDKKIHNFTTPVGKIYMINSIHNDESPSCSNASSDKSLRFEKSDNLHNENNYIQERSSKKTRILKSDTNLPSTHLCKPIKKNCNGILKVWPTSDPTMKTCNGGIEIYRMNEEGVLKLWHSYLDGDRGSIKGNGIGKKGHMLDDIWENCKKVQGDNTYWWYDQKSEEEERREIGVDIEGYDPPRELMDALPLGRENGSRFREMIRKEVDGGRKALTTRNGNLRPPRLVIMW